MKHLSKDTSYNLVLENLLASILNKKMLAVCVATRKNFPLRFSILAIFFQKTCISDQSLKCLRREKPFA